MASVKPCLIATLLAGFALSAHAATPVEGWYTTAFGGVAYNPANVSTAQGIIFYNNVKYRVAWNAGLSLGYKSGPIRYEGELNYIHSNTSSFTANAIQTTGVIGGSTQGLAAMANIFYDFDNIVGDLAPFLGVGIGYAHITAKLTSTGPVAVFPLGTRFNASDNRFAYQGMAGITYNFSENFASNLAYKYLTTTNSPNFGKRYQAHMANLTVIYRFDHP